MDGVDKQPVRLSIFNQTFTLRVSGDTDEILRAANDVDELMSQIAKSGNMETFRIAILACLHLQDRIYTLENELTQLRSSVSSQTSRLTELLDGVVPAPEKP
jgi:cell division protein ZapA